MILRTIKQNQNRRESAKTEGKRKEENLIDGGVTDGGGPKEEDK